MFAVFVGNEVSLATRSTRIRYYSDWFLYVLELVAGVQNPWDTTLLTLSLVRLGDNWVRGFVM